MKPSTRQWVKKAEADFATALREFRARRDPNYDDACFHAQQCIEKYLKARLIEAGTAFPRSHDLEELLELNLPQEPLWEVFRHKLIDITSYAVVFRYPGKSATRQMAQLAVADCKVIRDVVRNRLGIAES